MDDALFWKLLDESVKECGNDIEGQCEWLVGALTQKPVTEIFEFEQHLIRHKREAYDDRLMAAAAILDDMDDDDFQDFRLWLILRGKAVFEECLQNPEALGEIVELDERITAEEIGRIAARAYKQVTGVDDFDLRFEIALPPGHLKNPIVWQTSEGYPDLARLRILFPRLWAKFGSRFDLETGD